MKYEAKNRQEAWEIAAKIFGSDYIEDETASQNAGYKIYTATDGSGNWISDLGECLELNFVKGETERVWVKRTYTIEEVRAIITQNRKELDAAEMIWAAVNDLGTGSEIENKVMSMAKKTAIKCREDLSRFGVEFSATPLL